MRWRKRHQAPTPPPRPRTRRDLADADAGASGPADLPAVPSDIRVHRDEAGSAGGYDEELFAAAAEHALEDATAENPAPPPTSPEHEEAPRVEADGPAPEPHASEAPAEPPPSAEPPAAFEPPAPSEPTATAERDAPPVPPAPAPAPVRRRDVSGGTGRLPGDAVLDREEVAAAGRAAVRRALDEDLGVGGDVTSLTTVPPDAVGRATIVARADGVVAGVDLVALVYDHLDPRVSVEAEVGDGERVRRGQALLRLAGPLRSVLTGERTALNLLTHLSGVASRTAEYVAAVEGTGCVVRDTRKTTPGLRLLEKAAVRAGGGVNHRVGLSDAVLVKDNHVAAAGGVGAATRAALAGAEGRHVQVEVDTMAELDEALDAGARDILLDNFDVDETRRAVDHVRQRETVDGRILLETSGGVTLETVRGYAEAGVDRVAVGALTHSSPQLDIALDVASDGRAPDVRFAPGPVAGDTGDERIFPAGEG